MRRAITATLFFVALIALWEGLVRAGLWNKVLVPSPLKVLTYFQSSLADGTLLSASWVTLQRLLLGYVAGVVLGVPLGMACARWKTCQDTVGVLALGLQTLPSVCWAPLALLWFGQNEWAIFFITFMGSLWSISLAVEAGVRNVPPIYSRAARTMGSRGLHMWVFVVLPASLPFVVSGMKQGWAFAWRSLMSAEIYVTILTGLGLGHLLHYGRELHAMEQVIGIMLLIVGIGLAVDRTLFLPWERFMHRRWGLTG
jgi:NitT/TauT family transport system permease protein